MLTVIAPEVQAALGSGGAVVALESTLVAHGLPWPDNHEVAQELEAAVRAEGAVPATIALVDGVVRIGLDAPTLERLAKHGRDFVKAGATELAVHVARKESAATTVSATAVLAAKAGIRVFATGGIGGVHRGDANDVSHDLVALSRTPIAVVSAGAKSILDLPRTVEMLETLGVLVVGYRTREFPAFYSRSSAVKLSSTVESISALAALARVHWYDLGGAGILVCNPIPLRAEIRVDDAIEQALADAERAGIRGKALTPYLLGRLATVTKGESVVANRALALHNATVAGQLAKQLVDPSAHPFRS
jgi:pseudouridine-5'-phosphate glycosidase